MLININIKSKEEKQGSIKFKIGSLVHYLKGSKVVMKVGIYTLFFVDMTWDTIENAKNYFVEY